MLVQLDVMEQHYQGCRPLPSTSSPAPPDQHRYRGVDLRAATGSIAGQVWMLRSVSLTTGCDLILRWLQLPPVLPMGGHNAY
jgi:hypothetical protein